VAVLHDQIFVTSVIVSELELLDLLIPVKLLMFFLQNHPILYRSSIIEVLSPSNVDNYNVKVLTNGDSLRLVIYNGTSQCRVCPPCHVGHATALVIEKVIFESILTVITMVALISQLCHVHIQFRLQASGDRFQRPLLILFTMCLYELTAYSLTNITLQTHSYFFLPCTTHPLGASLMNLDKGRVLQLGERQSTPQLRRQRHHRQRWHGRRTRQTRQTWCSLRILSPTGHRPAQEPHELYHAHLEHQFICGQQQFGTNAEGTFVPCLMGTNVQTYNITPVINSFPTEYNLAQCVLYPVLASVDLKNLSNSYRQLPERIPYLLSMTTLSLYHVSWRLL
jgi:hypothetical protein